MEGQAAHVPGQLIDRALKVPHLYHADLDSTILEKQLCFPSGCTRSGGVQCSWMPSIAIMRRLRAVPQSSAAHSRNWGIVKQDSIHLNFVRSAPLPPAYTSAVLATSALPASPSTLPIQGAKAVRTSPTVRASSEARNVLPEDTPPQVTASYGADPANTFDLVVVRSRPARLQFQSMVNGFQCPQKGWSKLYSVLQTLRWYADLCTSWDIMKTQFVADEATQDTYRYVELLAMKRETACAAAFYSEARVDTGNTFRLAQIIRTAGDDCKGSGAAILCHLIRNSKTTGREFSPLIIELLPYRVSGLERYYESFGCRATTDDDGKMTCDDPNPQKCAHHSNDVRDADDFFLLNSDGKLTS
eukprot:gnl/TRDRNA2_/TRDRNA2_33037_c0_seq1.p1 gnl/TRDRNA2_/TRDRNA2_33037_c0~~gnl/TRDRNA2_/TRDRNA2_33037_c0_seq1.p1  ORF type:complete len:399 (+),score=38.53 gnl/TRDRNA2_/TRDRNA2_33037_c0_seq1:124-1197(+)